MAAVTNNPLLSSRDPGPISLRGSSETLPSGDFGFPDHKLQFIEFQNETERERFKCVKCTETLRPPVKQTQCGHRLCSLCVDEIRHSGGSMVCPGGEPDCVSLESTRSFFPDKGIVREIQNLHVQCKNTQFGCEARVCLKDILEHEDHCEYETAECPNSKFGCKEVIPKCKLTEHQKTCKVKKCKHCKKEVLQVNKAEHEKNCLSVPTDCVYKAVGCETKDVPTNVQHHCKEEVHKHLDLMLNKLLAVEVDIKEAKDEISRRKEQDDVTEKDLKMLEVKLSKTSSSYKEVQKQIARHNETLLSFKQETEGKIVALQSQLQNVIELSKKQETQLKTLPQTGSSTGVPLTAELARIQNFLAAQEIQFREFDLRFQCLETASYDGVLIWKIRDYRRRKQEAVDERILSLYSQPFYTSKFGYKMCARVYLNGDGMGKNSHLSLFFVVMKGDYDALLPWPFKQKVTLTLLDQINGQQHLSDTFRPDPTSTSFKKPSGDMNIASGCPLFVAQSVLERSPYLNDDTIYIKVTVEVPETKFP